MMIGFVNPRILLPKTDLAKDELRFILKHELVHYKRKDLWYKCLVLIATAVHWFNPIYYFMAKAIEVLCEISCDAEVVRSTDADTRQHYSETIIGVVKYQSKMKTALSTNFYGGKNGMKKRIFSIMDAGKKKAGVAVICAALFVTVGTGFAVAANTGSNKIDSDTQNTNNVAVSGNAGISTIPEEAQKDFAIYKEYGLTYNVEVNRLYYNGELVRYFEDYIITAGETQSVVSSEKDGNIDLYAVRNSDGELIGVEPFDQADFDLRTAILSGNLDGTMVAQNGQIDPNYVDTSLNEYLDYGISYDATNQVWIFENKQVHFLVDGNYQHFFNNFLVNIITDSESTMNSGVALKVVRNSNNEIETLITMGTDEVKELLNVN